MNEPGHDPGPEDSQNPNPWHNPSKASQRRGLRDHPRDIGGSGRNKEAVSPNKQKGKPFNPMDDDDMTFLPPIFLYNNACPDRVSNLDLCEAAKRLLSGNHLIAAQRFGPLWHLYPKSLEARARLVGKKLEIGSHKNIIMFSKNPSNYVDDFGQTLPGTKLLIDKAPMPMSNSMIKERLVKEFGLKPRSGMKFEPLGFRTSWLSGRRFMHIDLPKTNLPLTIDIGNPPLPISLYYREQDRSRAKQTPADNPLQTDETVPLLPSVMPGPDPGLETTVIQLQPTPKGKTPDTGKPRCLITEPLEPGEVVDPPLPTLGSDKTQPPKIASVDTMTKPADNHVVIVTRPQIVPTTKQKLLTTSTGYGGRCLISDPLEPGEIVDLPSRCLISDPIEQGEIIDLAEGAACDMVQAPSNDITLMETTSGESKHPLHLSFLQTSTVVIGNEELEDGEISDELKLINNDSTKTPPQNLSESIPHPVAPVDLHDAEQPTAGLDSPDTQQNQDEATSLSPKQGTNQTLKDASSNECRGHISFNINPSGKPTTSISSSNNSKGDLKTGEKPSPNKNFKSPNIASPNGTLASNTKKRKNSKSKLPTDSPNQPTIKSSFEARSRSMLRRSDDLLTNRSQSLKRPSPSPGKDKASKITKVGEDKASNSINKLSILKT